MSARIGKQRIWQQRRLVRSCQSSRLALLLQWQSLILEPPYVEPSQSWATNSVLNGKYVITLAACIGGIHLLLVGLILWIARPIVITDDSNLAVARLLKGLVEPLGHEGGLLDGTEIAEAVQRENVKVGHGVREAKQARYSKFVMVCRDAKCCPDADFLRVGTHSRYIEELRLSFTGNKRRLSRHMMAASSRGIGTGTIYYLRHNIFGHCLPPLPVGYCRQSPSF